jgi:hypothetical protein
MEDEQHHLHGGVLGGIARLADPCHRKKRQHNKLVVYGCGRAVDRQSVDHLVNFLGGNNDAIVVTELELRDFRLSEPSDGGVDVLRTFFARSETTLTKVTLYRCGFGSAVAASQLLAAFERNRTVSDLSIRRIDNLQGAALGRCLSGWMCGRCPCIATRSARRKPKSKGIGNVLVWNSR